MKLSGFVEIIYASFYSTFIDTRVCVCVCVRDSLSEWCTNRGQEAPGH